ncbi:MAG: OstA-like protein [Candidatus Kapaibacterium sp.]
MTLSRIYHAILIGAIFGTLVSSMAWGQPVGPSQTVVLEHADTFSGHQEGTEEVNDLVGHVRITQGLVHIEADHVLLYPATNRAILTGNVKMTQPEMTLLTSHAEYDGATKVATATSGVTLIEAAGTLTAGSGRYYMYERRAEFENGVQLQDGHTTLRAASGVYYSLEQKANFTGGVNVDNDSGTIVAHDLTYWRASRESYATGNVVVTSHQSAVVLTGDTVRNVPVRGYTIALGHPRLVKVDTVAAADSTGSVRRDTTVITARKMESYRIGREEYIATDSVRLRREKLEAVAALARFLPGDNVIGLGSGQGRHQDSAAHDSTKKDTVRRKPDSPSVANDVVTGVPPASPKAIGISPVVWYDQSQLTGDSITVGLLEKKLRTIDVQGNGFAVTRGKVPTRYDQLAGTRLFFDILQDTIRQVRSEGLASSIYFAYESERANGVNRTSGDTIRVRFADGQASNISIIGRRAHAEGEYFPEQMVAGQEVIYRLDGFRWIGRDGTVDAGGGAIPNTATDPEIKKQKEGGNGNGVGASTPRIRQ